MWLSMGNQLYFKRKYALKILVLNKAVTIIFFEMTSQSIESIVE